MSYSNLGVNLADHLCCKLFFINLHSIIISFGNIAYV